MGYYDLGRRNGFECRAFERLVGARGVWVWRLLGGSWVVIRRDISPLSSYK